MKYCFMLFMVSYCNFHLSGQELYRLKVSAVQLIEKEGVDYTHRVDHLMYTGEDLFCGIRNARYLVKMNANAELLANIGRPGGGPGEFASRVLAYSTNGQSVFAVSADKLDHLQHFSSDGRYVGKFPIKPRIWQSYSTGTCNTFGVSADTVVLPAPPQSGHLAYAYDFQGGARPIGDLIFDKRDASQLELNPFLNDTLWVYGDGHWYAVLRFTSLILKYDSDFNMVSSFRLDNPRLTQLKENLDSLDPSRSSVPQAMFRDIKYHQGFLFIMAPKTLIQINAHSGDITAMYTFYGDEEVLSRKEVPHELNFKTFALMGKNRLLLGPAWIWDHDLMQVTLPTL